MSLPITVSRATDRPPSVCNEPSVVEVASVVESVLIIPLAVTVPVTARAEPLKVKFASPLPPPEPVAVTIRLLPSLASDQRIGF